ncbi:MAG: nucleotidyltransferase domain-containing protein [Coprothermobacterota bacterium]|nr:nucleotidyltransferase domain-containing protein [Coprothermobacterota bacterium]
MVVSAEILREITERLLFEFHPHQIILFGSQAGGIADDRSDVDILVVCPIERNRRTLMVAMDRALKGLGIARDIIVLSPEEFERDRHIPGSIARPAFLEGKILYERH